MGLDMYLTRRTFYSGEDATATVTMKPYHYYGVEPEPAPIVRNYDRVLVLEDEVGYWRKANAIHGYFVRTLQNGVDDCGAYDVSLPELQILMDKCKEVLEDESKAHELLPPTEGFLFGSTEIDEAYRQDLRHTIAIIERVEKEHDDLTSYRYSSSW